MKIASHQEKLLAETQDNNEKANLSSLQNLMIKLNPVEHKAACDNLSKFFTILKEWDEKEKAIG